MDGLERRGRRDVRGGCYIAGIRDGTRAAAGWGGDNTNKVGALQRWGEGTRHGAMGGILGGETYTLILGKRAHAPIDHKGWGSNTNFPPPHHKMLQ